jgi:hypothetical protein
MLRRRYFAILALVLTASQVPSASAQGSADAKRKPDLGDVAEGRYVGDVISDSKGSSHPGVTLTVTRIGVNRVHVASDYPRLPEVDVTLTRAMDKIVQTRGNSVFLYDPAKHPVHLDVSFNNEVSWSGAKQ